MQHHQTQWARHLEKKLSNEKVWNSSVPNSDSPPNSDKESMAASLHWDMVREKGCEQSQTVKISFFLLLQSGKTKFNRFQSSHQMGCMYPLDVIVSISHQMGCMYPLDVIVQMKKYCCFMVITCISQSMKLTSHFEEGQEFTAFFKALSWIIHFFPD